MLILSRHIENILLHHNCVIIPGFGGLLTQNIPARFVEDEALFLPPHRSVSFNNRLVINDGMLVQSYMSAFAISYADAAARVDAAVQDLKMGLMRDGEYKLHGIGTFRLAADGGYTFEALEAGTLSPELYGLDAVAVKPMQAPEQKAQALVHGEEAKDEQKQKPTTDDSKYYVLRLNKMVVNYMAAAIVMLVCYFTWAVPVKNTVDVHLKQAAFFATDIFTKPTEVNLSLAPRIVAENEATGELDIVEPSTYVKEEAAPQEVQASPSKPTKQYTIVVCSCVPRANAEKLIQSLSEQGVEAEIFVKQDILRVVVGTFASRSEAEQALKTMHEGHQAFKDAWILKK